MVKQADSGAWSILAAVAAAFTPVLAKALIARRRRAPLEEQTMCRNHSHVTGRVFSLKKDGAFIQAGMLVTQPLSLETSAGESLTLPAYSILFVRLVSPDASLVSQLQEMAAQAEPELFRAGNLDISGPTTPPK